MCFNEKNLLASKKSNYGKKLNTYIRENYHEALLLEEVANEFHLNKSYFCCVIKKELGKTFSQAVNEIRIKESKILLRETQLSLLEIALSVGFNNQSYFNMAFKKLTAMTPSEYRSSQANL